MIQLILRIFQHLLPHAEAWRLAAGTTIRKFFQGLTGAFADAVNFVDLIWLDLFPSTTRQLAEFEKQFGLEPNDDEAARRLRLAAEWAATGGQSPAYIEGILQTAGFDVYVHECWASGPPWVARDPRNYTLLARVGSWRCGSVTNATIDHPTFVSGPRCSKLSTRPRCNRFLNNDPHYIVNKDLTLRAPPPIPADPLKWPYFFYVGGQNFPDFVYLPESRRADFERLLLKLRPAHLWIVTRVVWEGTVFLLTGENGSHISTEGGNDLVVSI